MTKMKQQWVLCLKSALLSIWLKYNLSFYMNKSVSNAKKFSTSIF